MNNGFQHNNNHHDAKNNGFDNDHHRRTPPAPTQIDDEINDDRHEHQIPHSPDREQIVSSRTQV
jgi:hypothetical protein